MSANLPAPQPKMLLSELLPGPEHAERRQAIVQQGYFQEGRRRIMIQTRPDGQGDHEVLAMAAVARDPGKSVDYLDTIQDYETATRTSSTVERYYNIYYNEGIVNNAINKIAALLSTGGRFKVKGSRKGKARKPNDELEAVLAWWQQNVNAAALTSVITGARGLKAVTQQGVRQALIEGSWVGRAVWVSADIPGLKSYDLPMNIQAISTANLEPVTQLQNTGIEMFYWVPPSNLLQQLRNPTTPEIKKLMDKYIPNDLKKVLKNQQKVLLDPALLAHVKHRGNDRSPFGESFIQPALAAIAYKQAVDQLDIVSMQSLVNRMVVVKIGSDDPASPYSKVDVAQARQALFQSMLDEVGPNMLIVWAGSDIDVLDVGAHGQVLALDDRHKIGEGKIKLALGVPDAFLSGSVSDGKSSGMAAMIGAAAELEELQNAFAQAWTAMGERIAAENGWEDVVLIYEFDRSLMVDREAERNQNRLDYAAGLRSIHATVASTSLDPDAEYELKRLEKGLPPGATWEEVFSPPMGLPGQGTAPGEPPSGGAPGAGRQPKDQTGNPAADRPPEAKKPVENK